MAFLSGVGRCYFLSMLGIVEQFRRELLQGIASEYSEGLANTIFVRDVWQASVVIGVRDMSIPEIEA